MEDAYRMLETADGVRFGMRGRPGGSPAAVAFLLGSLIDTMLHEAHCEVLNSLGFVCVALDAPGHGLDEVAGEPRDLHAWSHRLKADQDFVAAFTCRLSKVLDHLVAERIADPDRVAVVGGSRGGFLAFHFAANDARVRNVAGLAPVTDLRVLAEFEGLDDHALTKSLSAIRLAGRLAGRNVLVVIGDLDDRVGTDHAIVFAREVTRMARDARVELHVLPEPGGHCHPEGTNEILKQWAREVL